MSSPVPQWPPSVDRVSKALEGTGLPEWARTEAARRAVALARDQQQYALEEVVLAAKEIAIDLNKPHIRPVINMSGVVLHTALGRAVLCKEAVAALQQAGAHQSVEFDEETGGRGDRQNAVRTLLMTLTGAEDALVVNNCAAAVVLTLAATCQGREVLLSRGQMVEIGGSFRMPDIVASSGCELVEVGCTNRTRTSDYAAALTERTSAILRCHPSNYKIVGFTEEPSAEELVALAHAHGLMLIDDVGHGCIVDTTLFGLRRERTLREALKAGADVVLASSDKLLGGPQAGLILGRKEAVDRIAKHPLARAVRVDKLTLAALEATLRLYVEDRAHELPVWRYASRSLEEVGDLSEKLRAVLPHRALVEPGLTEMGGGSLPGAGIPTRRVGISAESADEFLGWLRGLPVPVVGRIETGKVWLDPRTAELDEVELVANALKDAPR